MSEGFEELKEFINKRVAEVDKKKVQIKSAQHHADTDEANPYSNEPTQLLLLKIAKEGQLTLRECRKLLSGLHMTKEESKRFLWQLHKDKLITISKFGVRITLTEPLILSKEYYEIVKEFQDHSFRG